MTFSRILCLTVLFALAAAPPARAQQKVLPAYPESDAGKHVGEEAAVTGKVIEVSKSAKGTSYLNFGARFPRQTFSGVVFTRDADKVGDLKPFEGKTVTVTGRIELSPDQKPQILINAPSQIKLAEPGESPASPSATPPATSTPASAATASPPPKPVKKIALSPNWDSPAQRGEMTRKDLALLFGGHGTASESAEGDPSIILFPGIPFLAPLAEAKKPLQLEGMTASVLKVTCPGLPASSFTAHVFSGVFTGGYNRLDLITDNADQVVSILFVDETPRQRISDLTDTTGYHTYNFIHGRAKGNDDLLVKHQIETGAPRGVVIVESMLIDPNADEPGPKGSPPKKTAGKTTYRTPRSGKVMERSRWIVPETVVNLILRSVGSR